MNGGLFVGKNKKTNAVVTNQGLDLVHYFLWIANTVVTPELPLAAEGARKGAATGKVGNGHTLTGGNVYVMAPFQNAPVGRDAIKIGNGRLSRGRHHFAACISVGNTPHGFGLAKPCLILHGKRQVEHDLLALTSYNNINPRRFLQNLWVHKGGVNAT